MSAGVTNLSNSVVGGSPELGWLKLLADPETLAQRISQYEKAKGDADAAIALVGAADDITRLREEAEKILADAHAQAEALKNSTTEVVNQMARDATATKAEAETALEAAKTEAQRILDEAAGHHATAAATKTQADEESTAVKARAARIFADAQKTLAEAAEIKNTAVAAAAEAAAAKTKYESKIQKIQAATAED